MGAGALITLESLAPMRNGKHRTRGKGEMRCFMYRAFEIVFQRTCNKDFSALE